MLFLFTALLLVFVIICIIQIKRVYDSTGWEIAMGVSGMILALFIFIDCGVAYSIRGEQVIENQIAMYQEENLKFEEKMAAVITDYMKHESDVVEKAAINSETLTFYVAKYPELKSDELIKKQIDQYNSNKHSIMTLKNELLNIPRLRWLLYFG